MADEKWHRKIEKRTTVAVFTRCVLPPACCCCGVICCCRRVACRCSFAAPPCARRTHRPHLPRLALPYSAATRYSHNALAVLRRMLQISSRQRVLAWHRASYRHHNGSINILRARAYRVAVCTLSRKQAVGREANNNIVSTASNGEKKNIKIKHRRIKK